MVDLGEGERAALLLHGLGRGLEMALGGVFVLLCCCAAVSWKWGVHARCARRTDMAFLWDGWALGS